MKVVVDTNILFSTLLNPHGKIGHLLFNSSSVFEFYCVTFLKEEIDCHTEKLLTISGFSDSELSERKILVYKQMKFIDVSSLPIADILTAVDLVQSIDPDDMPHVALAKYLNAKLWTGDKALIQGLREKGYEDVIDTNNLWDLRNKAMEK
ncbi:MAG: hypothetical protein KI791_09865 [Cyclobacteriaceae bacterium]|nr:hypothetical protein [Cyclobacteriaceae bacterium SS2]